MMKHIHFPTTAELFERMPRFLRRHRLMKVWMRIMRESSVQLVRIRGDAKAYADLSDGFMRLIVIENEFELDFFRIANAYFDEPGCFFDVGANHGHFSFGLAGTSKQRIDFHLFEPNATLISTMHRSRDLYPNITISLNHVVVSDQVGKMRFTVVPDQTGISHVDKAGDQTVDAITLDAYADSKGIQHIDLLKIDVEGHELNVLRGGNDLLSKQQIQGIYLEVNQQAINGLYPVAEVFSLLASHDYTPCFCRHGDFEAFGAPTYRIANGHKGAGLQLRPVGSRPLPAVTDLLAVPSQYLEASKTFQ